MRVAVLQPSYLPWLGFFDQIAHADAFVFYDDVQFDKGGWRNRNRIRTPGGDGWTWLTLPIQLKSHFPPINEVIIDERAPWGRKHLAAIRHAYARAPHLDSIAGYFGGFFESRETNLAQIAIDSISRLMAAFGLSTPLYRSSELGIAGDRNDRLLQICKLFSADHYLSGAAARAYLDVDLFERSGIEVEWQDYQHPSYRQCWDPFVPRLSALDALLCLGPQAAASLFDNGTTAEARLVSFPQP